MQGADHLTLWRGGRGVGRGRGGEYLVIATFFSNQKVVHEFDLIEHNFPHLASSCCPGKCFFSKWSAPSNSKLFEQCWRLEQIF